jgi:hypothetical protein
MATDLLSFDSLGPLQKNAREEFKERRTFLAKDARNQYIAFKTVQGAYYNLLRDEGAARSEAETKANLVHKLIYDLTHLGDAPLIDRKDRGILSSKRKKLFLEFQDGLSDEMVRQRVCALQEEEMKLLQPPPQKAPPSVPPVSHLFPTKPAITRPRPTSWAGIAGAGRSPNPTNTVSGATVTKGNVAGEGDIIVLEYQTAASAVHLIGTVCNVKPTCEASSFTTSVIHHSLPLKEILHENPEDTSFYFAGLGFSERAEKELESLLKNVQEKKVKTLIVCGGGPALSHVMDANRAIFECDNFATRAIKQSGLPFGALISRDLSRFFAVSTDGSQAPANVAPASLAFFVVGATLPQEACIKEYCTLGLEPKITPYSTPTTGSNPKGERLHYLTGEARYVSEMRGHLERCKVPYTRGTSPTGVIIVALYLPESREKEIRDMASACYCTLVLAHEFCVCSSTESVLKATIPVSVRSSDFYLSLAIKPRLLLPIGKNRVALIYKNKERTHAFRVADAQWALDVGIKVFDGTRRAFLPLQSSEVLNAVEKSEVVTKLGAPTATVCNVPLYVSHDQLTKVLTDMGATNFVIDETQGQPLTCNYAVWGLNKSSNLSKLSMLGPIATISFASDGREDKQAESLLLELLFGSKKPMTEVEYA